MPDFDYFAAELSCPICGTVNPVAMRTEIQYDPHGAYLRVGDRIRMGVRGAAEADYLVLRLPLPNEEVHLLHLWDCSNCGSENWAEVVLDDDLIVRIEATQLDREVLDRAHFISSMIDFVYDQITGLPLYEPLEVPTATDNFRLRSDWIERLREKL